MKIQKIKINGMVCPVGYVFDSVRVAWQVCGSRGVHTKYAKVEIAKDADFIKIISVKAGVLNSACTVMDIKLEARTRYFVRVSVTADNDETAVSTEAAYFETGKIDEEWQAKWLTTQEHDTFHPIFLRDFSSEKYVKQARLYISGLGLYEASLNGKRIGEERLTPYFSNYHQEVQYQTYDVTELIERENELRVSLGNGWYKGRFGLGGGPVNNYGSRFMMIAELHLTCEDGTEKVIASDESWSYIGSDFEETDIYDGEILNRLLWDGKENTQKEAVVAQAKGKLVPRYSIPVLEMEDMPVKEMIHTPAGETVLDFGQNFAGYVVFHASQPKGTKIVLDFGEVLQNGSFYNENYRSAKSRYTYISDGTEEDVKPHFTFFGFRYVRVTGWMGEVCQNDFMGKAVYSKMEQTGTIKTGHKGVNQLFSNALWGQKSNSVDFPTDCPQRDERLGWCGDAQVFSGTASYNMDTAAFYRKFLHDLRTEQVKYDGILPGVIPVLDPNGPIFAAVWGDIATFLPTVLYEHFGDIEELRDNYPMMKDWVDKITKEDKARGQRYLFDYGNQLGDWLALDGRTEQSMMGGTDEYYIASCYYAASVQKVANAAKELGCAEDESYYRDLYEHICAAILKEYFSETGRLCCDTQTGYLVALYHGIYKDRTKIVEGLKGRLYRDCYKLKGGFVGAPVMCRVMAENGMEEEAFYFLLQNGYPGWMHCIDLGATTIWERWNSVLDDGRLSGIMMNSLNHYAYGAVVEYLYRDVAGLKALEPGFKKALITPLMNQKLKNMSMAYECPYGVYRSEWEILDNGNVRAEVEVPFDCTAVVGLPFADIEPAELTAGVHKWEYTPSIDLRALYSKKTLFKDMMQDEKAKKIIERISPLLQHFLSTEDPEFLNESLDTLKGMFFMGFSDDEVNRLESELTKLIDGNN